MSDTMILLWTCAAGMITVACIASLSADVLFRDRAQIQQRLSREFQSHGKQNQQKSPIFRDLKMLQSRTGSGRLLYNWWDNFSLQVEQSGLSWSPHRILAIGASLSLVSGVITYLLLPAPVVAGMVVLLGLTIPLIAVEVFRQRRRTLLCQQLPEAFDQMKRSVRAGLPVMTAMQQIAIDFPAPLSDEFAICCQKQELGLSQSIALQDLARRVNIMELQMFVVTVLVQRDIGGNTAEILGNLSNVVRQRFRLSARVKALTAEGRMQALVLAALPLVAGGIMTILNAEYVRVLFDQPKLLLVLFVSELIGAVWIRRIVNFDY